jgi:hypothetical protein
MGEWEKILERPMLIADLGQHDLILGRKWFAENKIWLNPGERELVWPEDRKEQTEAEKI